MPTSKAAEDWLKEHGKWLEKVVTRPWGPVDKWRMWTGNNSLEAIIIHKFPQCGLSSEDVSKIIRFRSPHTYQGLAGKNVEAIYDYLKEWPDEERNPWKKWSTVTEGGVLYPGSDPKARLDEALAIINRMYKDLEQANEHGFWGEHAKGS